MRSFNLNNLAEGNNRQRKIHHLVEFCGVMEVLTAYSPTVTGTIPINIDLINSDIDIICEVYDCTSFKALVCENYGKMKGFRIEESIQNDKSIVTARFTFYDEVFEIYGEPKPVTEQNAYLHMIKESAILNTKGESFRQKIIQLKKEGMKTEPAFAHLLGLKGDPYIELLKYEV